MYTVPDQTGRHIVVTGANSGTGKEATARLAAAGARVTMAVRSLDKGEAARAELLTRVPGADLRLRRIDLADLASVRTFAEGMLADGEQIDTLVNNAGVMIPPARIETVDGYELQFQSNFLGPFLLTNLLLPRLLQSTAPRVATMSSGAADIGSIHFGDLQFRGRYSAVRAYAQSKLADLLMTLRLAELSEANGWGLLSTAAHPGYTRTNLQTAGRNLGREKQLQPASRTLLPSQGVEQGAEPLLFAAADPAAVQGAYYGPSTMALVGPTHRARLPRSARGRDLPASLWAVAAELTGLTDGETTGTGTQTTFGSAAASK
ncbi:SDR family oxidoreductase [Leifsonia shinshuensis]|uniref:SDR family oxidoreductase n=1 Tax=Leifsonia shinshuensis TaxID=150026 RepID=UPI001F506833|nr:SDR family oxidoreductase [Leifsonia shinshuensis]MCI0157318.1 SDR family oxidoreductase [Leifsonia shinshuensis]